MKTFALFLLMAVTANAEAPTIPDEPPMTATSFACADNNGHKARIVATVVTYPSGKTMRFDADHMHGFTVKQLAAYADSAKDSLVYWEVCVKT
jgi:hypothetical protein